MDMGCMVHPLESANMMAAGMEESQSVDHSEGVSYHFSIILGVIKLRYASLHYRSLLQTLCTKIW